MEAAVQLACRALRRWAVIWSSRQQALVETDVDLELFLESEYDTLARVRLRFAAACADVGASLEARRAATAPRAL